MSCVFEFDATGLVIPDRNTRCLGRKFKNPHLLDETKTQFLFQKFAGASTLHAVINKNGRLKPKLEIDK